MFPFFLKKVKKIIGIANNVRFVLDFFVLLQPFSKKTVYDQHNLP